MYKSLFCLVSLCILQSGISNRTLASNDPFPSTYVPGSAPATLIYNTNLLTGTGELINNAYLLMKDGEIIEVAKNYSKASDAIHAEVKIDGKGKWLTPGIIDVHSHLGNYASPAYESLSDGNEATSPNTAEVWTEHSVWPQDPQFPLALAGGVTTLQILPGSANLFGGRSVVIKNVSSRTVQGMKFPGAPYGLKMACGENPKRVYGKRKKTSPSTRMGNVAGYRKAWIQATEYMRKWDEYEKNSKGDDKNKDKNGNGPPTRDLRLETLVGVLKGEIRIHNHCYRADEMAQMIDISKEFGYKITAFHHGVEAYKIADLLKENQICGALWADWWRFKMESFDGIKENIALVEKAGACAIVHSDSPWGIQRLNQEAAKALSSGQKMGMDISEKDAIKWITANPAKALGILDKTGTLEKGKMADVILWDKNPFSVYAITEKVYIDGSLTFDRSTGLRPRTDFELGQREDEL